MWPIVASPTGEWGHPPPVGRDATMAKFRMSARTAAARAPVSGLTPGPRIWPSGRADGSGRSGGGRRGGAHAAVGAGAR
ncbi:hypothetical protein GCM10009680_82860 [Streptomyces yatensis]|uniref:Uncharacterized protein n=1 Tax=Streptomyces yatensis TaxID=155177 RepID=A0ABN2JJ80_9ACTN